MPPLRLLLLLALASPGARAEPGFVAVRGADFVVDGKPFRFVGANLAVLHGEAPRARYADTIAAAASDGLTVGRVWAFGEGPADASEWFRRAELFRAGPDGFLEAAYLQLDRVLAEARRRGVRLILTLGNHWSDYGGIPMYLRWAGLPLRDSPDGPAREAFYRDERTRAFFRAGVAHLLERTNTITGVRYVDDPTIFGWELLNESSVTTRAGAEARRAWIAEMARFIKERDAHHLVAAGLGGYSSVAERAEWVAVHQLPEIDYCDSHLYPQAGDLVTPDGTAAAGDERGTAIARAALARLRDLVDDRAQLARFVVGKPLVIGEFGFRTNLRRAWLGAAPADWFRRLLDRAASDGVAGALAWIYQPFGGGPRDFGIDVDRHAGDGIRDLLRSRARKLAAGATAPANPRLGAGVGDRLLYDPRLTFRRDPPPHRRWRREPGRASLAIPPDEFVDARFERAGSYHGGAAGTDGSEAARAHVWGVGSGRFRYRFVAPPLGPGERVARIRIAARMSSEWPGVPFKGLLPPRASAGPPAPADGGSTVELRLDGTPVARLAVVPDDGAGVPAEAIVDDPALLRGRRRHTLTFAVPDAPSSHGLCIYGAPLVAGAPEGRGPDAIAIDYELEGDGGGERSAATFPRRTATSSR